MMITTVLLNCLVGLIICHTGLWPGLKEVWNAESRVSFLWVLPHPFIVMLDGTEPLLSAHWAAWVPAKGDFAGFQRSVLSYLSESINSKMSSPGNERSEFCDDAYLLRKSSSEQPPKWLCRWVLPLFCKATAEIWDFLGSTDPVQCRQLSQGTWTVCYKHTASFSIVFKGRWGS